jgi:glycosyltransferase involved in cell wall biosynthesis
VSVVHVIVPEGIDDSARPSGGNAYDRRVCHELTAAGWSVLEYAVAGSWPQPAAAALSALRQMAERIPDSAVVLVDGLIASAAAEVLVPQALRLHLVVLVHLPLGAVDPDGTSVRAREQRMLSNASGVVTTSAWTRDWLVAHYGLDLRRVHVAHPGVDRGAMAHGTPAGGELLCVAAVTRNKGHDVLLAALAQVADLPWRLTCIGSRDRDPQFAAELDRRIQRDDMAGRVRFTGPRIGADLELAYESADALVLASHVETYGMVVTEALAHGLPVIATSVGGVPEALGAATSGRLPGLLAPPGDADALADRLGQWLREPELRGRLRQAAYERRTSLAGWSTTSRRIAQVLTPVAA